MAVEVRSYNQILGDMVRKMVADTPLNDINTGSVLLSLLEAAAQVDFENNASILNVLELLNIDAVRNNDLDARGADYGLARRPAQRSNGFVNIGDSNISKRSTGLYQVKQPPIAGSTTIYVNDASTWSPTGFLYLGRGTNNFEGPISYTGIVNNGSFFTIALGSALQKDHLISDVVVDGQGTTDRLIPAGTVVYIPANSQNPNIEFITLRNAVIPAGEDVVLDAPIVSSLAGSRSNAGINTISNFSSPPFSGATVYNTTALTNATDVETDTDFRERIKSYASTLARGTKSSILSAILGLSSPEDSKQVASAIITEPPKAGDPSILYIDDGTGFQPSFSGQSVDQLLSGASGNEEFLQLSNYPLPRPQTINTIDGPFQLVDGMQLRVLVDGIEESITFNDSMFSNISAATLAEIIIAINDQSSTFKATFTSNSSRLLLFPVEYLAELIQVSELQDSDDASIYANNILKFPTNEFSYIRLYQNNNLLHEQEKTALLQSAVFSSWNITLPGNLVIAVDGTPTQDRSFDTTDFAGTPLNSVTLEEWSEVFNNKFAGLTAVATSSNKLRIQSNKIGTASSLEILGGTYFDKMFGGQEISSVGQEADFELNRQTGNLRILKDIEVDDTISAGTDDAKGNFISEATITGTYNVSSDGNNRDAEIVVVADAGDVIPRDNIVLALGNTIEVSLPGSDVMKLLSSSADVFNTVLPHDYLYITSRGVGSSWIEPENCGIYRVIAKGGHTNPGVDTWVEVKNVGATAQILPPADVLSSEDIQAFRSDAYPQLWKGSFTSTPPAATLQNVIDSFNDNLVNIQASIFKTDAIKISSVTENDGSIAIPVSIANASLLFPTQQGEQVGNPSHIANRVASKDVVSSFKITEPTSSDADGVSGKVVWFDRVTYSDSKGVLTSNAVPGTEGIDTYSEELQSTDSLDAAVVDFDDIYNMTGGNNKRHYRSIRDILSGDRIGTQHSLPRTLMDHTSSDSFTLMRPVSINSEDSIVSILDQDSVNKTVDIKMARTGRISTGFPPTSTSFSAYDVDNEVGITFSNLTVWSKTANNTEFKDYAVWFRARNWYVSGGATSGGGAFLLRSREYGPHGENHRFRMEYPSIPSQDALVSHANTPDYTTNRYVFGSGPGKSISTTAGDTITVSSLGGYDFRYTFNNPATNLATVVVDDVISMLSDSGISSNNRGQFGIKAVNNALKYIDIYNPNGSVTGVGVQEETDITAIADILGSQTVSTISGVLSAAAIADNSYFTLYDAAGAVAVVYDKNSTVGTPASYGGANRILVVTLSGAESDATVTALTSGVISADAEFSSTYLGTTITVMNADNGAYAIAVDTSTGFGFAGSIGSINNSLDGKYFVLRDANGSVAFWYDVSSITSEPLHGASRSVRINTVNAGDSSITVATKTAVIIAADSAYSSAIVVGSTITATDAVAGGRSAASAGTSGFTLSELTAGSNPSDETIAITTSIHVFPLTGISVGDIVDLINSDSVILYAAEVDAINDIKYSTAEEVYTPAGPGNYSVSLSYGHDPDPLNNVNDFVSLYDGINWVKQYENLHPNFVMKTIMTLQGVAPTAYALQSAPNHDTADLGEFFKLVPITLNNIHHHFTQKALSQLPILANVDISSDIRKVQIKSKLLGSEGAVEMVGGNANGVEMSIFGEGQIVPGVSKNFLEVRTAAFPITLTRGDYVELQNTESAKRLSRIQSTDTIDVFKSLTNDVEYRWNAKSIGAGALTTFSVVDISAAYVRPAGTIWRWTHSVGGANLDDVVIGDLLCAFGTLVGWSSGNRTLATGDNNIPGFPIINVNSLSRYIDVVNPSGVAMPVTAIGAGTVSIVPTPITKWKLKHGAKVALVQIIHTAAFGTDTATTVQPHRLREGDSFVVYNNTVAQTAVVLSVVDANNFTFTDTSGVVTASTYSNGNLIKSGSQSTRYKIESLNFNKLYRLAYIDGNAPGFVDCGAAVDDLLVIGGESFKSLNNGTFRILGVDNESVIFQNNESVEELNTVNNFNNLGYSINWISNFNEITGVVGAFANLATGYWVKKKEDEDIYYVQVLDMQDAFNISTSAALAVKVVLGSNYRGNTGTSLGVSYDQENDVDKGVILRAYEDVQIIEGDSVRVGDSLVVDNIVHPDWFNPVNTGVFTVTKYGSTSDCRPIVHIDNQSGLTETNIDMSVDDQAFFLLEGSNNRYASMRRIEGSVIGSTNTSRRQLYMSPPTRVYKISQSYGTKVVPVGKLTYSTDVTTGIDGYSYYTGLLRTVQRVVDGYEPDQLSYPGRRAIGGAIEILPPLIKRLQVSLDITTHEGVNLNEIANDIKSSIIGYINGLGVGEDVVLAEMIVRIMDITGVEAATFNSPAAASERISVSDFEKAFIEPSDISVS